jgi:hypothetical protein
MTRIETIAAPDSELCKRITVSGQADLCVHGLMLRSMHGQVFQHAGLRKGR